MASRSGRYRHGNQTRRHAPVSHEDDRESKKSFNAYSVWAPGGYVAFRLLLAARMCAALWSNISDCDETFNYWEPMHYLLNGYGFQTWEYSPAYGLRSYAYLWLYAWPLKLHSMLFPVNKILHFYSLRCLLALLCSLSETFFYRAVCRQFGPNIGRLTLGALVLAAGMFTSSTAFLPSSFCMKTTMMAMGCWFMGSVAGAVFFTALGALVGWPFCAALGIPIALDIVIRRREISTFILWSLLSFAVCLIPLVAVDSHYYGGLVVAPFNILVYNVFTEHGPNIYGSRNYLGGAPANQIFMVCNRLARVDLETCWKEIDRWCCLGLLTKAAWEPKNVKGGVEPWSYYFINCFLNLNVVFILAVIALPVALLVRYMLQLTHKGIPVWLSMSPVYIWMLIFFTRPHKEERFLFPIYPLLCLLAAVCIDQIQRLWSWLLSRDKDAHYTDSSHWLSLVIGVPYALACLSRMCAIYYGYHAPLEVYGELQQRVNEHSDLSSYGKPINVCVGKEWYRYPSSFFLPNERWQFQFIKSEFSGQLPKPYSKSSHGTRVFPSHMNDANREEPSRYVNISSCHYLVDLDVPVETTLEPRYSQNTKDWQVLISSKFLDNARSHRLFRAFFIPYVSSRYVSYVDYNILVSTRNSSKLFRI